MNNTAKAKALDALYAQLPKIQCQGKCTECCCNFGMTGVEQKRIERVAGPLKTRKVPCYTENHLAHFEVKGAILGVHNYLHGPCPLLKDGRCSVYEIRPITCRIWGLTERMACPFGCKPERLLTDLETFTFMREALRLSL